MIDKIKQYPNDVLLQVCDPVEFDAKAKFLGTRLLAALDSDKRGRLGVAAPQIGVTKRAFSYNIRTYSDDVRDDVPIKGVAMNPAILDASKDLLMANEGCLSFPGQGFNIRRPNRITVEWFTPKGVRYETQMLGMASRVFQHEMDHINGILILDRREGGELAYG